MDRGEVLIVGINNFLGKAIYDIIKTHYSVIGVYNYNKENIPVDIEVIQIDAINNLKERIFNHIYLISSHVPGLNEDDQKLIEANIVLPEVISKLFPQSRIIFCSSVAVYENIAVTQNISINSLPSPKSKYALSKLWGERTIQNHTSYGIIRISSMYGIGMKTITFVPKIIENAILKKEIDLLGNGERLQNYIHVNDVANIAVKLAEVVQNTTLLAVGDQSYSNKDIAEIILDITPGRINFYGEDNSKSYIYNNAATHEVLGKIKFKDIREGLEELVAWSKKRF